MTSSNKSACCKSFPEIRTSVSSWAGAIPMYCFTQQWHALSIVLIWFLLFPYHNNSLLQNRKTIQEFCHLLHIHFNLSFRSVSLGWISDSPGPLWGEPGPSGLHHEFPLYWEALTMFLVSQCDVIQTLDPASLDMSACVPFSQWTVSINRYLSFGGTVGRIHRICIYARTARSLLGFPFSWWVPGWSLFNCVGSKGLQWRQPASGLLLTSCPPFKLHM